MMFRPMQTGDVKMHTQMHTDLNVKCPLCLILTKTEMSSECFTKFPNIKFHQNPFTDSQGVTCTHGQIKATKIETQQWCKHA